METIKGTLRAAVWVGLLTGSAPAQKIEIPDWENAVSFRFVASQEPVRAGDQFEVALVAQIEPGYHLYGPEERKPSRTEVSPSGEGVVFGAARFPKSIQRDLEGLGTYYLYEGTIAIRVPVTVSKGIRAGVRLPISLKVNYQVCTDFACSAPTSKTLSLETVAAEPGATVVPQHRELFSERPAP